VQTTKLKGHLSPFQKNIVYHFNRTFVSAPTNAEIAYPNHFYEKLSHPNIASMKICPLHTIYLVRIGVD